MARISRPLPGPASTASGQAPAIVVVNLGDGWDAVLMTTIPYTINDGPWQGAGFFRQLSDAKAEYMALVGRTACPLLNHYLASIAKDLNRESELGTAAFLDHVWELLEEGTALRSKGPKPSLCRWYSWVDAHAYWRPWFHLRVVIFLFWAMGCGLLTRKTATQSFSLLSGPKAAEEVQKETMREQASKLSRLRAKGKNMLHVSLLILMNPLICRKANMVYEALQAMRLFHGHQVEVCKSPVGNRQWSALMSQGSWVEPLVDSWRLLWDATRLHACGFLTSFTAMEAYHYSHGSPLEEDESAWVSWLVVMLIALTRNRIRHLLFYTWGPGLLAGLLHESGAAVGQTLRRLQALWTAWRQAEAYAFPVLEEAKKRSWLRRPLVKQLLTRLEQMGWLHVPDDLRGTLLSFFSLNSTKVVRSFVCKRRKNL